MFDGLKKCHLISPSFEENLLRQVFVDSKRKKNINT